MQITVTLDTRNASPDDRDFMDMLVRSLTRDKAMPEVAAEPEAPTATYSGQVRQKRGRKKAEKPAAASKKEQAKVDADPPAATATLAEVREKFTQYVSQTSPQTAVRVLNEFKVGRVSDLDKSQYGSFLGRLVDLLK